MMDLKNLYIEPSEKAPHIDLNSFTGELLISGKSIPENAALVYEKAFIWANEYIKSPRPLTNLRINLEYFNTSSAIWISKIVRSLCSIKNNEYTLIIHIYFSIEDFDTMNPDDLKDELHPIISMIGNPTVSLGIRIYGTDENGEIVKESMVLL
jgi:hypothetical protein